MTTETATTQPAKRRKKAATKGRTLTSIAVRHSDKATLDQMAAAYRGMKLSDTVNLLVAGWHMLTDQQRAQAFTTPKDSAPATVPMRSGKSTDATFAPA